MNYLDCFSSVVRELPRFMALAEAVMTQVSDLQTVVQSLLSAFSLDHAEGSQLDQTGAGLSVLRPAGMTDADYRSLIRKKLRLRQWNGTNEDVPAVLQDIDPSGSQRDNDNLSVTIAPSASLPVPAADLYPIPAGVTISQSQNPNP